MDLQPLAYAIEGILDEMCGQHVGFVLLVFPFDKSHGMGADYVSNANQENIVKLLREIANRLDGQDDIGVTKGNA